MEPSSRGEKGVMRQWHRVAGPRRVLTEPSAPERMCFLLETLFSGLSADKGGMADIFSGDWSLPPGSGPSHLPGPGTVHAHKNFILLHVLYFKYFILSITQPNFCESHATRHQLCSVHCITEIEHTTCSLGLGRTTILFTWLFGYCLLSGRNIFTNQGNTASVTGFKRVIMWDLLRASPQE